MPDIEMFAEEVRQQINYAKMLVREERVDEALRLIAEIEEKARPHYDELPASIVYLIPFVRGRAYLQIKQPSLAQAELEAALKLSGSDLEGQARVQNLLGVAFSQQEQPYLALQCHLSSVRAIMEGRVMDFNLRINVYRNLATDYWALNSFSDAINVYKEALHVLKDLNEPQQQADIFWGLALAYKAQGKGRYARLYIARALQVYQSTGSRSAEAAMHINFAEILIEEGQIGNAANSLDQARELLSGTDNHGLLSFLHRYYADIARKEKKLDQALWHCGESMKHAETLLQGAHTPGTHVWVDPVRTYAESLHAAALVQEAMGNSQAADLLFTKALDELGPTTLEEERRSIHLSYVAVLEARGDYERAVDHYKAIMPPST
ncbi:MAG: tetratricopeptide repeat protein [Chloroflexota bacterium]